MSLLHVERCGTGSPVLFIHGMPTSSRLWTGVTQRLRERYTCYSVDLPGMGRSPRQQYGAGYLRSVAEQVEALRIECGVPRWHVVGHDAGSVIAANYASAYAGSVERLALLSPALFSELKPYFLLEPLRHAVVGEMLAPVFSSLFWRVAMTRALGRDGDARAALADFRQPFLGSRGSWKFMRVLRWGKPSQLLAHMPQLLASLPMPTLILHGMHDPAIPRAFAERAGALIPNASLRLLDCGHFLPICEPTGVAGQLAAFFAGVPHDAPVPPAAALSA